MGLNMKNRQEVDKAYTWNMEDMLPSDQAWEAGYTSAQAALDRYQEFKGHVAQSAKMLYECLQFDSDTSRAMELLLVYARQKSDEDTADSRYQEMTGRIQTLSCQAGELSAFIIPEILEIDESVLERYMQEEPGLRQYRLSIRRILKKKEHTLDAAQEALLAQSMEATQSPGQIFNFFNNADLVFPEIEKEDGSVVQITHGNFIPLMESASRKLRREVFSKLYSSYEQFSNTLAAVFSANVKQAVFYAKARNYSSSRAYYLSENEIPETVYDHLLDTVHNNLPLLHRYMLIRKKKLNVEQLHMYDLYVPLAKPDHESIPYEEAQKMVLEGLAPLGEEYIHVLREAFGSRWIDVYENKGKRSGAYSWGAYGIHPYVLLNYNHTLNYVFTLAHEMGHALHSYFSDKNQPYHYAGYTIFVAEVASTCNEALLIRHLLRLADRKEEKAYLLNHFLDSFRTTLFRQAMFAEFEMLAHQKAEAGETLTAQILCRMYRELNETYFGPEMEVDAEIDYEWSRIPHFYTPFYVYQYATGFSAAVAISSRILAGDEKTITGYRRFLEGGCSDTPIELLKRCGVDMSTPRPVEEAMKVFGELLDLFEE